MKHNPPETDDEKLLREYVADVSKHPEPTKAQWQTLMARWADTGVNIESLLLIGDENGWTFTPPRSRGQASSSTT